MQTVKTKLVSLILSLVFSSQIHPSSHEKNKTSHQKTWFLGGEAELISITGGKKQDRKFCEDIKLRIHVKNEYLLT